MVLVIQHEDPCKEWNQCVASSFSYVSSFWCQILDFYRVKLSVCIDSLVQRGMAAKCWMHNINSEYHECVRVEQTERKTCNTRRLAEQEESKSFIRDRNAFKIQNWIRADISRNYLWLKKKTKGNRRSKNTSERTNLNQERRTRIAQQPKKCFRLRKALNLCTTTRILLLSDHVFIRDSKSLRQFYLTFFLSSSCTRVSKK